jgi:hypothetical protein
VTNILRNLLWMTVGLGLTPAFASAPPATLSVASPFPAGVDTVLLGMAKQAGVIFAGHVIALDRNDTSGFVDIHFRIDEPIRGCPHTGVYVLREWAGRWIGHPERYRVGQRWLMFLTPRGPAGMSAPVFGGDGAVPIIASAPQPILGSNALPPADPGATPDSAVDLRLLQTRVVRAPAAFVQEPTEGAVRPIAPLRTPGDTAATPLSSVLALLRFAAGGSLAQF